MGIKFLKPSLVVKNNSKSDVKVLGMKVRAGTKVDLFNAVVGLTEERVIRALQAPSGEIYTKVAKGVLSISKTTLNSLSGMQKDVDTAQESMAEVSDIAADAQTSVIMAHSALSDAASKQELAGALDEVRESLVNESVALSDVLSKKIKDVDAKIDSKDGVSVLTETMYLERKLKHQEGFLHSMILSLQSQMSGAMSGNLALSLDAESVEISAADLNAAAAGAFVLPLTCSLVMKDADGYVAGTHSWMAMEPVITAAESVADSDVGLPNVHPVGSPSGTPKFSAGVLSLSVVFDTGAGKTYADGDEVSVSVKVTSDNKLLGFTVPTVTKVFTVVE